MNIKVQEAYMICFELEDSKSYKTEKLRTKRPVAEKRYRCYKNKLVQCLFKEWGSRYQVKKEKQIILTIKLTCVLERLSTDILSYIQE